MKNFFDLIKWECKNLEAETLLSVKDRTLGAQWKAKELEKENEITEIELRHKKEMAELEARHSKELLTRGLSFTEDMTDLRCVHKDNLSELREELKTELGAKAIELEKENEVLKKELSETISKVILLTDDKKNLRSELRIMTDKAIEASAKSAEVRIIDTKVVSPQVIEGKINVISTCGK